MPGTSPVVSIKEYPAGVAEISKRVAAPIVIGRQGALG